MSGDPVKEAQDLTDPRGSIGNDDDDSDSDGDISSSGSDSEAVRFAEKKREMMERKTV